MTRAKIAFKLDQRLAFMPFLLMCAYCSFGITFKKQKIMKSTQFININVYYFRFILSVVYLNVGVYTIFR